MEERKWEELNRDCLVEILVRVGTETVARSIPFVCKSWYDATLDPRCWQSIIFPERMCSDDFIEFVVGRSQQQSATSIVFPNWCTVSSKTLLYMADRCPALKVLHLPSDLFSRCSIVPDLIGKLKNLEFLKIRECTYISILLESINNQCSKNFYGLDCGSSCIDDKAALSIVQFTPKIKHLTMRSCSLLKLELITILKGCRELELLDVSYCSGFESDDVEILNLASHIKSFSCTGSYEDFTSEDEYFDDNDYSGQLDDDYWSYKATHTSFQFSDYL